MTADNAFPGANLRSPWTSLRGARLWAKARGQRWYHQHRRRSFQALPTTVTDPFDALRQTHRRPLLWIDLSRVTQFVVPSPFSDQRLNPFTRTAAELLADPGTKYEETTLFRYHRLWATSSVLDVFDLGESDPSPARRTLLEYHVPWSTSGGDEASAAEIDRRIGRYQAEFASGSQRAESKWAVEARSHEIGRVDFDSYRRLVEMVRRGMFHVGLNGFPRVQILSDGSGDWTARAVDGNHRLAVLAGMGTRMVQVIVNRDIVERTEARSWQAVRNGVFSQLEAEKMFDAFFRRSPSQTLAPLARRPAQHGE